jgi:hypothetical protein
MYRLVALPFLDIGMSVAIAGYRTYPDADVTGQVDDLFQALHTLLESYPYLFSPRDGEKHCHDAVDSYYLGTCLIGHSSGAHLSLLMMVEYIQHQLSQKSNPHDGTLPSVFFDSVIGLSGPYNISHHFDFEAHRGVEELSPMKPACGHSREEFRKHSPPLRLVQLSNIAESSLLQPLLLTNNKQNDNNNNNKIIPSILLLHGMEDSTVPFTSTSDAAALIRSCGIERCDEIYIGKAGHQDTILHLMLGGVTRTAVIKWIQDLKQTTGHRNLVELVAVSKM